MARPQRSEEITKRIIDLIIERDLPPGAPMPTELSLMDDIGVSRNSIREAIKALQALGIVEIRHGYGTFVGSAGSEALQTWLLFRTRTRGASDAGRLRDLLEVREMIETELTSRVALEHRPELIGELQARVARMRRKGPDSAVADREFHDLICAEAGFDLARELTGLFWDVYRAAEAELGGPPTSAAGTAKRHQAIVDALAGGDAEAAAEAVHRHFDEVRKRAKAGRYGGFGEARPVPADPADAESV
ncbi:FadR/GntR family transcriptional regulator [Amycolatopsis saalfeldensis]|uniref:DNA-binding transcriptional regulator, FadR family n=1 Tax=Amycolatopsis saalfeldensis TaxID=394193 RepID=A0A1H8UF67_9PSEU|nr:FCD domain-containing protein [Amycolatopsis saalfeldensis]SEP01533.1 DNA-binding transcriptional regulator, FadR family [Amycolatopsis saalfeldensis]